MPFAKFVCMSVTLSRDTILSRYEKYSLYPLVGLGIVFIVCYALPIVQPDINPLIHTIAEDTLFAVWVIFIVDYVFRLAMTRRRWEFIKSNVVDLVAIVVPAFRPLRALRIITIVLIATRRFGHSVRNRTTLYVIVIAVFVWLMGGLAITDAERNAPGASIQNVNDGWWWSFTSLVVGGSGAHVPVTDQGKLIEAGLFLAGLALLGTISAALAAWFVDRDGAQMRREARAERQLSERLLDINAKLDLLLGDDAGAKQATSRRRSAPKRAIPRSRD